jgi:ribosomal protein S18 acetylase RimI-like enzyme
MIFTIRAATPADAPAIARIHVDAWEASYRGILPDEEFEKRPLERRRQQWRHWFEQPQQVTLVAQSEGPEIIGFAGARLLDRAESGFDSYLATLYLLPDCKRAGLGTALLAAIADELVSRGARTMVLRTLRLNANARAFYEKLGARFISEGVPIEAGHFDDVVYAFNDLRALQDRCAARRVKVPDSAWDRRTDGTA